jgi:SAM-dependent methyltransferase
MTGVHDVAAAGFDLQAEAYERARPSYPPDAVGWLAEQLGIGPGRCVVDLAAGTGKLTVLLAPLGAHLVAIEPVEGMRRQFRRQLPGVPLLAGAAEALPLGAATVDAVCVAQAFHWFDAERAMAELARVLRPGGRLGLLWNARDRSEDWVDRVWAVLDRVEKHAPWRDHGDGTGGPDRSHSWREDDLAAGDGWAPFLRARFSHVHRVTHDQMVDRMRSVSHIAVLPPAEQAEVLDEVRAILREHPDTRNAAALEVPYQVDAMVTERLVGPWRAPR